mgnify:FL=1
MGHLFGVEGKRFDSQATHDHIIRFTPPLVITEEQMMERLALYEIRSLNSSV